MNERDDQLLNDLLDGRLSDDEASALRARIAAEPPLRERYDGLVRVGDLLREQDPAQGLEAPASFLGDVTARIAQKQGADGSQQQAGGSEGFVGADAAENISPGSQQPGGQQPGDQQPGAQGLRMSDARTGSSESAPSRPAALRYLGFAYAAAALIVVGIGVGFVVSGKRDTPPATELATQHDLDSKPDRAGSIEEHATGKEGLHDSLLPGSANPIRDVPKIGGRNNGLVGGAPLGSGPVLGPGGSVRPGLREPSNSPVASQDPAPAARGERLGRTRQAKDKGLEADAHADQPPVLLFAVHAEDPAAARAGLQLMLYQIAQADGVGARRKRAEASELGDRAQPADQPSESNQRSGDQRAPDGEAASAAEKAQPAPASKPARSARNTDGAADDTGTAEAEASQPSELAEASPVPAGGPTFELRRLELASLDKLIADRAEDPAQRNFRPDGAWGSGRAQPRPAPTAAPPVAAPAAPRAPTPVPTTPTPALPPPGAPAPESAPAPPATGRHTDGPAPDGNGSPEWQRSQGLADGVVDRVLTLDQLRALEARFGIRATDVRHLQSAAGAKKEASAQQLVRVRFVFVQGLAPRR